MKINVSGVVCVLQHAEEEFLNLIQKRKKTVVNNPNTCMVACQTCANLCPVKAISFAKNDKTREKRRKL